MFSCVSEILKLMTKGVFFLSQPFKLDSETPEVHDVDFIDIAYDEYPEKHYVKEEVFAQILERFNARKIS